MNAPSFRQLPLRWSVRFALLRLRARWRSLSTAMFGMLLVAIIGASIPLYSAAIAQLGMVQHLDQLPDAHIYAQTSLSASNTGDLSAAWRAQHDNLSQIVAQQFDADLPGWAERVGATGETTPMIVVRGGEDENARLRIAYAEGWQQAVDLLDGGWPAAPSDPGAPIEAAIDVQAAARLDLAVGDEIMLDQRGWATSVPFAVRIAAIVRAPENAPADTAYMLRIGSSAQGAVETNLLTTREGFLRAAQFIPDAASTFGWWVMFDHSVLPFARVDRAAAAVDGFRQALPAKVIVRSGINAALADYVSEVERLQASFGLLLVQIGALALFFLIVTAALIRRAERREIAVLQSRGAANWQITLLDGLQTLVIGAGTAAAAPFLARQFLAWIVPFLTEIDDLPLVLETRVFAYAGVAASAALIVLTITLIPILRLPLVIAGGMAARGERRLWWQRYYLDVVLLIAGVAALWRLVSQGTPLIETSIGGLQTDPLLLLAPIFVSVAIGSIVLRLFPTVSGWAARASARWGHLEDTLATWQVSREPAHYGRLSFLLALAIGLGWLATSFHATLQRSQHDRAAYQVGADVRVEERDRVLKADRVRPPHIYRDLPGVQAVTSASRFFVPNASNDPKRRMPGEILAVDPATFAAASYWREDLGPRALPTGYAALAGSDAPGRLLPGEPTHMGLWARLDQPYYADTTGFRRDHMGDIIFEPNPAQLEKLITLNIHLHGADGYGLTVRVEPVEPPEGTAARPDWIYFEGNLSGYDIQGSLWLDSIAWINSWNWDITRAPLFRLLLADLTLTGADGTVSTLDWLEAGDGWELLAAADVVYGSAIDAEAALPFLQVNWEQTFFTSSAALGLFLDYPDLGAVPVIASRRFAELNRLLPGTRFQLGYLEGSNPWFELRGTVDYAPTLYPARRLFLVADQRSLLYALNRRPGANITPSEIWLDLKPGADPEALVDTLQARTGAHILLDVRTVTQVLDELNADMLQTGLIGLLYLAFGVALVLSLISLITYMVLTARQRRADFGVLQAMGLSARRLVTSILLEQAIVIAIGVTLGVLLGTVMSDRVLPTLAFSTTGETITPPFDIRFEAAALLQYAAFLLVILVVTFGASLALVSRLSLAELLRFGEE